MPLPEEFGDLVGCEPPQPQLTAALEELVDGEVPLEDGKEFIMPGVSHPRQPSLRIPFIRWSANRSA